VHNNPLIYADSTGHWCEATVKGKYYSHPGYCSDKSDFQNGWSPDFKHDGDQVYNAGKSQGTFLYVDYFEEGAHGYVKDRTFEVFDTISNINGLLGMVKGGLKFGIKKTGKFSSKLFSKHTDDIIDPPVIGRKLDYMFGLATGKKHNIDRSKSMLKLLNKIGIEDTTFFRDYVRSVITKAYYTDGLEYTLKDGRVGRDFIMAGPDGFIKVSTVWDGPNLITMLLKGGKK
jgi:hypothetical protein